MYWRLLTSNPTAAREIVLSEKPVISTETDRMDKGMLDQVRFPVITADISSCCTQGHLVVYTIRIQTWARVNTQLTIDFHSDCSLPILAG
jgi:hypothetical protein